MTLFNASGELVPEYDKGGLPTLALSIDQGHGVPYSAEDLTAKSGQPPGCLHHAVQQVPFPECCVHLVSFGFQIWPPVYQGITGDHYIWRLEQEKRKIMKVQCWVKKFLSFFYNVFFLKIFKLCSYGEILIYFCSSPIWCIDDLMSMISNFPVCTCIYYEELEFLRFHTIYLHHNKITDAQTDFNTYTSLKDA